MPGWVQYRACMDMIAPEAFTLALLAHTAYHLGEIRQALCMLAPG